MPDANEIKYVYGWFIFFYKTCAVHILRNSIWDKSGNQIVIWEVLVLITSILFKVIRLLVWHGIIILVLVEFIIYI